MYLSLCWSHRSYCRVWCVLAHFHYLQTKEWMSSTKWQPNFTARKWKFSDKNTDIFHISAQNIDCGYLLEAPLQRSSNEYPQSMFLSGNKKNDVYPCKLQFYDIKVGLKGINIIEACFRDEAWRPRSDCIYTQSEQGLGYPLTESLDIIKWSNWTQRPRWDCMRSG